MVADGEPRRSFSNLIVRRRTVIFCKELELRAGSRKAAE
jgi:hypothetical protein